MSLVNKMLKDLSERQRSQSDPMRGLELDRGDTTSKGFGLKLLGLVALVAVVLGGLWFVYGPKSIPIPEPRAGLAARPEAVETPSPQDPSTESVIVAAPSAPDGPESQGVEPAQPKKTEPATGGLGDFERKAPARRPPTLQQALRAGNDAVVEARLIDILVADRKAHPAREALVGMRIEQGRLTDARRSLNIGLGVAPDHEPYRDLDLQLRRLENPGEPRTTVVETTIAPPLEPAAAEATVIQLLQSGNAEEATKVVARSHAAYPGWAGYRKVAARIELARGAPRQALALLQPDAPAIAEDPEHHGLMASAFQRLGRHDEASRGYRELLKVEPEQGRWWAGYGISREALGDREGAASAYARALERGNLDHAVRSFVTKQLDQLRTQD